MSAGNFASRLELLEVSGQLSGETRRLVELLVGRVEDEFGLQLTEERGAMFVTHVAIAWEKLRRGDALPAAPDNLIDEVQGYTREREFLANTFCELDGAASALPGGELAFWTAHLVAVRQGT